MNKSKKLSIFIIISFILQIVPLGTIVAFADQQAAPVQLMVDTSNGKPGIGYTSGKGNFVNLIWTAPTWSGDVNYYEIYYAEDGQAYQKYEEAISGTENTAEVKQLKSGTVYRIYLKAVHEHYDSGTGALVSKDESESSNELIVMTNIELLTTPAEDNSINIEWTDIHYKSRRVAYNLYISESKEFAQTPPIYIDENNIGASKSVKPVNGRLQYRATGLKAGTVYYVKIQPLINDEQVFFLNESTIVNGYTFILATISQVSSDWWKLAWNPVTNSNLSENQEILYKIKRCMDGDLEQEISATKDTQMFVKVAGQNTYYKIQADILSELGETISVVSQEIYAVETDIPAVPGVPEIMDQLSDQTMTVGPNSIKVLWKVPSTQTGDFDSEMKYDIWLLNDPDGINDNTITPNAANLPTGPENYLYEMIGSTKGSKVIGYQYTITGLNPNSVYYLKMIAKKSYVVYEDGQLVNKEFPSEPALREIITLPAGSIDQPIAPSKPPFKVKTVITDGRTEQVVTSESVTLEWKNQWYELWNETSNKWEYADSEEAEQASVQGEVYRLVNYDDDVRFSVGYEVYTDDFDYSRLLEITGTMPTQFNDIPNNTLSDTVEFTVTGLNPNTQYIMWVRAYRSDVLRSGLSEPIVVTTRADNQIPAGKPAIPVFNYKSPGDTYVDIWWNVIEGHNYTINYSEVDDIDSSQEAAVLTADDVKNKTSYRIEGLTPDTEYYFWIMASIEDEEGNIQTSEWSDAYTVKTTPYAPPEIPEGFGLKNIDEPIGQHYIHYEWIKVDGLEYTLELAVEADFSDKVSYQIQDASEYKAEGLTSNTKYYARLYAFDAQKDLYSQKTSVISVRTLRSNDEYDSDVDKEAYNDEPLIPLMDEDDDIAVMNITGVNVDKFIRQLDQDLDEDYLIDFTEIDDKDVNESRTVLSSRVLVALNKMKKTLTLNNGKVSLVIRPEILNNEEIKRIYQNNPGFTVDITLEKPSKSLDKPSGSSAVSDQWDIIVMIQSKGEELPVTGLKKALKIKLPYTTNTWYDKNTMSGYAYNEQDKTWRKLETTGSFNQEVSKGYVYADIPGTCSFVLLKWPSSRFADISGSAYEADINAILNKYEMKSLGEGNYEPNRDITKGEAVKMLLDIMNVDYDSNYIDMAAKAKITANINMQNEDSGTTREQAASMLVRIYELITGEKAASTYALNGYSDSNMIDAKLLPNVRFAIEKGILKNDWTGTIRPKNLVTRGEMMSMIKNTLEQAGQL